MATQTRAQRAAHFAVTLTALLLPTLSLIPLGGLYLWEKGYVLYWAATAAIVVAAAYGFQAWLLRKAGAVADQSDVSSDSIEDAGEGSWTPVEQQAWADVRHIARSLDSDAVTSVDDFLALGQRTIEAVAKRLHPEKKDALWQFTLPEALAISERVSNRLAIFIREHIPFGDRLTVSQILQVYRWRFVSEYAERAYDIWRIVRMTNPVTAATSEARERLSKAMMLWGKEQLWRRLFETYVEEVGRAGIDLYGGRLRIPTADTLTRSDWAGVHAFLHAPLRVAVISGDPVLRDALSRILHKMAAARSRAVIDHLQHGRELDGLAIRPALEVSPDPARAGIIGLALTGADGPTLSALEFDTERPPLLLPVIIEGRGGNASELSRSLQERFRGRVLPQVGIDLTQMTEEAASERLWSALEKAAPEARRIQFGHARDANSGSDWFGAARQAAGAVGRLARAVLPTWPLKRAGTKPPPIR